MYLNNLLPNTTYYWKVKVLSAIDDLNGQTHGHLQPKTQLKQICLILTTNSKSSQPQ